MRLFHLGTLQMLDPRLFPVFSTRTAKQTLSPLAAWTALRSHDGTVLNDQSVPPLKFVSVVEGTDERPPAMDTLATLPYVVLACLVPLSAPVLEDSKECKLQREPVQHSLRFQALTASESAPCPNAAVQGTSVVFPEPSKAGFLFYRPLLKMRLSHFDLSKTEWEQGVSWKMVFEEI